jgi:glycine/D-amino acid oxidase-like deaminating enzyme
MALRVAVVGAGAFGGWTALELVRRGASVTLVDAWGPGHARSSSGGETRIMRASYGARAIYTTLATRSLELWHAHDARFKRGFFRRTGALWMAGADDRFGRASADTLAAAGVPLEALTVAEAARRYPQINFDGIASIYFEPNAGVLLARRACEHVADLVVAEGGEYVLAAIAAPLLIDVETVTRLRIEGRGFIEADAFVFACGPWLSTLFPEEIGTRIHSTRQEVYYFGTPGGNPLYTEQALPVWLDLGDRLVYGIPGNAHRGFKIADDTPGPFIDPTTGDRSISPEGVTAARAFIAHRFPSLADAPLVGAEVCQYEATPDSHLIIDRHPVAANVWIAGGGSGHGFKHGPAVGEVVARMVLDDGAPHERFALAHKTAEVRRTVF